MCPHAGPALRGGSWVQDSGWPWAGGHPRGWLRGPCLLRGCLGRAWPPLGIVCGVGVSGRALGEGRQAGGSCFYRVSAFPAVHPGRATPMGPQLKRRPVGLVRAAGPGWVFVPPALQGVSVARGAGLIPWPKGRWVSRERAQRGKNREKRLAAFYPRFLPGLGAQQPLFLRMKAWPRTACCISVKARAPTVTWQGPSAWKPHFS